MKSRLKKSLALLCILCAAHPAWAANEPLGAIGGELLNDTNPTGGENLYIAVVNRTHHEVQIRPDFTSPYNGRGFETAIMPGTIPADYLPARAAPDSAYARSNPELAALGLAFADFPQENSFHFQYRIKQIGTTRSGVFRVDDNARARYTITARNKEGQDAPISLTLDYGSTAEYMWVPAFTVFPIFVGTGVSFISGLTILMFNVVADPFVVFPIAGVALGLAAANAMTLSGNGISLFNTTYSYATLGGQGLDNEYKSELVYSVIKNGIQYTLTRTVNKDPHITNLPGRKDALLVLSIENATSAQKSCTNMTVKRDQLGRDILSGDCLKAGSTERAHSELELRLAAPDADIVNYNGTLGFDDYLAPGDDRPYGPFLHYCSLHSYDAAKQTAQAECHANPVTGSQQWWFPAPFWYGQCTSAQLRLGSDGQLACVHADGHAKVPKLDNACRLVSWDGERLLAGCPHGSATGTFSLDYKRQCKEGSAVVFKRSATSGDLVCEQPRS